MNFIGTGRRLQQGDIGDAARKLGIETAALLAIIEVEAAGRGFDAQNRPKMLFEPHVFWRELGPGAFRDAAALMGLAYAKWGTVPYPKDSYPRLTKAVERIDKTKALRSASWGLGQLLGDKFAITGFPTPQAFVEANMTGEREQLLCMTALMRAWGIPKMLAGKDLTKAVSWAPVASKWNGSGYAKHNYHGRLAASFTKHTKGTPMTTPKDAPVTVDEFAHNVLKEGMKGEAVRNLQNDLAALGYKFAHGIDGRFGAETKTIVLQFQSRNGIAADGAVGPQTRAAIAAHLAQTPHATPTAPTWPGQDKKGVTPTAVGGIVALIAAIAAAFGKVFGVW